MKADLERWSGSDSTGDMYAVCEDDSNGSYGNKEQQREKERDTGKAAAHFSNSHYS